MIVHLAFSNTLSIGKLFILVLLSATLITCKEDVTLYTSGQPVPVVYSLLDPVSDLQYVRIGRSYTGGLDAMNQPPVTDSTVWNITHEVYIEEYANGQKGETYWFAPDSTLLKDPGFFPVTNLRVYSSAFKPVAGNTYQLYIYFPDLDKMVSARPAVNGSP